MAASYDFTKLRRLLTIHVVVQIGLVLLLLAVSWLFQQRIADRFFNTVFLALFIQTGLFFPIRNLTAREVAREIASAAIGLTPAEVQALRKKRVIADVIKSSIFLFFFVFVLKIPDMPVVLAITYFTFILLCLNYFQCFNYAARREMKLRGGT